MRKLATALALIAITAGSLVALEGPSFAAGRHGKHPVARQTVVRKKMKKGHKGFGEESLVARRKTERKKSRRHRKTQRTPADPGMNPVSG